MLVGLWSEFGWNFIWFVWIYYMILVYGNIDK